MQQNMKIITTVAAAGVGYYAMKKFKPESMTWQLGGAVGAAALAWFALKGGRAVARRRR